MAERNLLCGAYLELCVFVYGGPVRQGTRASSAIVL